MTAWAAPHIAASVAVYDGRHYLGEVAELANGQFAAFNADRKQLGTFDTKPEAERAVMALRRPS